ncbi:MAG: prepilin-type N-terminal cleavage/methylation domain-containing protein, partial [Chloroherpetonaceae bacterium]|nr:prepilin-type N-terminal cleavage/methylation domain-containing protein [Chthonomonadaceae bacterium]MDW8207952.1 prepilin-type N-terminal cleavage/methylation domain-containing protein [Chloroherpetonaceae bacterium]
MREGIQWLRQERRISGSRPGFTLLEILVVLVVLLIGIMTVLRLFPGGFLAIQRTGEATAAQALEAAMREQQKNLDMVADSTASVVFRNGEPILTQDVLPDDLSAATFAEMTARGSTDHPYFLSDCNRINWIIGETFRLPVPTPNPVTGALGSVHILSQGPVRNYLGRNQLNDLSDSINVYGMPMERIEQSSVPTPERPDPTPVLLHENQYAIDYERLRIAFFPRAQNFALRPPPNNRREFFITLDYYGLEGGVPVRRTLLRGRIEVPDVPMTRSATALRPVWQPIFQDPNDPELPNDPRGASLPARWAPGFSTIVRDTEEVSRAFRMLTEVPVQDSGVVPNWSPDDPYEYVWYSSQITPGMPMNSPGYVPANPGVLLFNPRGYDAVVQTSRGPQPFRVRVDYAPFDNHIIRDERTLSGQRPYVVRLSLPFILRSGDVLNDQTTYRGLFKWWANIRDPNSVVPSPDLMIFNSDTGAEIARLVNNTVVIGPGLVPPPGNAPA